MKDAQEYIKERVKINPKTGCWEWQKGTRNWGYGAAWFDKKRWLAHRLSYVAFNGDIPEKLFVCHSCDNPCCVNPAHLWLGTPQDNIRDRTNKGRTVSRPGEKNPRAKLSEKEVIEIKLRLLFDRPSKVAADYKISRSTVTNIKQQKSWSHVDLHEVI